VTDYQIEFAKTHEDIEASYPVMAQLRPHLTLEQFIERVELQQREYGYHLLSLNCNEKVCAVAGFRVYSTLSKGMMLYVDDLVTDKSHRQKGYGEALLDWIGNYAKENGCSSKVHMDGTLWTAKASDPAIAELTKDDMVAITQVEGNTLHVEVTTD
jgi:membrane protein implicated in regulation of membrane protease activity